MVDVEKEVSVEWDEYDEYDEYDEFESRGRVKRKIEKG